MTITASELSELSPGSDRTHRGMSRLIRILAESATDDSFVASAPRRGGRQRRKRFSTG